MDWRSPLRRRAAIPLQHPYDHVARGRVALLGDAASQVFSAHGSGVGPGLVAARLLADALAEGRGVEGYAVAWHRRFGGLHAGYNLFRRFTQSLDVAAIDAMMAAGLLGEASVRAALEQRWPRPAASDVLRLARGALGAPRTVARLAPVLARMPALQSITCSFPATRAASPSGRAAAPASWACPPENARRAEPPAPSLSASPLLRVASSLSPSRSLSPPARPPPSSPDRAGCPGCSRRCRARRAARSPPRKFHSRNFTTDECSIV